jgi:dihydroxy-acid dehydratase
MAAATVDIPAIVFSGGHMLSGWYKGERVGAGTVVWKAREMLPMGEVDKEGCLQMIAASAPSTGHCNPMGTALTMNSLAEVLGLSLPYCAAIPAPYGERAQMAYMTGKRIVEMVRADLRPSQILIRAAFENAIVVNSALGGSTNAPWHLKAIASHVGVDLDMDDWDRIGYDIPLLVNVMPAGSYLGEDFHRAGGVPAVVAELIAKGKIHEHTLTVNGKSLVDNCKGRFSSDRCVIKRYDEPLKLQAGFLNMKGNLFDSGIMKTSTIDDQFRKDYLSNPDDPNAFEGRAVVFDGLEDYLARIDDPALEIDEHTLLFMRGAGPIGYPGSCEIVNMRPPTYLLKRENWPLPWTLPCIGDGRQSGTSAGPSILNASPEAAVGGGIALLKTGDRVRIDLGKRTANILISDEELEKRRQALEESGGYKYPESQTP